jgi:uncharacterized membrane protein
MGKTKTILLLAAIIIGFTWLLDAWGDLFLGILILIIIGIGYVMFNERTN